MTIDLSKFTKNGNFLMLAFDHRGSFKKLMNPQSPNEVTDQQAIELKKEVIASVQDQFSALLIDQIIGLPAYVNKTRPFLLPVEKSGYTEKLGERITEIEFSIDDLKADGAEGAKILLYFNPRVASAKVQLHTAKRVLQECRQKSFPLFLEIRVYKPDTGDELGDDLTDLVLSSVRMFLDNGISPHVWKLEYPGTKQACRQITQMVGHTPWIILTKGASFETFVGQLEEAASMGCEGFLAGRAVWQEVGSLEGEAKAKFLQETLPARFRTICEVFAND